MPKSMFFLCLLIILGLSKGTLYFMYLKSSDMSKLRSDSIREPVSISLQIDDSHMHACGFYILLRGWRPCNLTPCRLPVCSQPTCRRGVSGPWQFASEDILSWLDAAQHIQGKAIPFHAPFLRILQCIEQCQARDSKCRAQIPSHPQPL